MSHGRAHAADSHDLIRVQGARENNLKDVSVELPKRRLTVFTGVSGSGKSSLVFAHDRRRVAADDQRDLQRVRAGLHADAGPARGRLPRRADDGDHRRPGADGRQPALHGRHRHRRQRDAADPLQPARARRTSGRPRRTPSTSPPARPAASCRRRRPAAGSRRTSSAGRLPRRHVPAVRGHGQRQRHRPHGAVRRDEVAQRGRADDPGLLAWTGGTAGSSRASGCRWTSRSRRSPRSSSTRCSTRSRPRSRSRASTSPSTASSPRSRSRCCPRTPRRCSRTCAGSSSGR